MLIGEYNQKLTQRRRVALPAKLRKELKDDLYITRGYEKSLVLVNEKQWGYITREVQSGALVNNAVRDTARFLIGGAKEVETDKQGRFVIPENLSEYAELDSDIVFVGLVNWVEVWSKEHWEERLKYLDEHGEEIAQKLNNAETSVRK
jgi:MraZ protein